MGRGPRQVVFSPDGTRAYVTTETGIAVISTAAGKVVRMIPDPAGRRASRSAPTGKPYTSPTPTPWPLGDQRGHRQRDGPDRGGRAAVRGRGHPGRRHRLRHRHELRSVSAISTSTLRTIATVHVGRLPEAVAVTPDGRQVWVGNDLSGNVTVINPATNTVTTTISGGRGTATLLAGPLGIAFTKAG